MLNKQLSEGKSNLINLPSALYKFANSSVLTTNCIDQRNSTFPNESSFMSESSFNLIERTNQFVNHDKQMSQQHSTNISKGSCFHIMNTNNESKEFIPIKLSRENKLLLPLTAVINDSCNEVIKSIENKAKENQTIDKPLSQASKDKNSSFNSLSSKDTILHSPKSPTDVGNLDSQTNKLFQSLKTDAKLLPFSCYKSESNTNELIGNKRKRFIKNNKLVFVRPKQTTKQIEYTKEEEKELLQINEYEIQCKKLKQPEDQTSNNKKPRGSKYRGVSKNGNQWQVLIMVNKKKRYVGSYSYEEQAAKAYDKVALQNHGSKAKTNFEYIDEEVQKIISEPPLLKLSSN